ncbi:unnamed protein product [Zymoseptoria tritici ST99CH_1A5]|uniref:Uncharacterized protein n=4 Tax=Zymoseptoria TaxID=1047167 RepID=A0A0F4GHH5_9PEZI|nr:hypothetical protein TI39_contig603g00006 [Zymoseptoria brevis]SMQ45152.1 unnamed protein product [Zymoseptoria tritici ST99CH_3D7]SMR41507.1 unnamed protein product [Zymoseptoria tritici ST99CH_1E4]SMY18865.1 unnamed protein product [Zymoseptoria tritici ST99CH_1A5]
MSTNQDPLEIAKQAERDLNTQEAKGNKKTQQSDTATESGIDASATTKFPGSTVTIGSAASGAGDNRDMPEGGINPKTGQTAKARDFEGVGGPEDKERVAADVRGGDEDVKANEK